MQPQQQPQQQQQQRSKMPPVHFYLAQMLRQMWRWHRRIQTMLVRAPISVTARMSTQVCQLLRSAVSATFWLACTTNGYDIAPHPLQAAVQHISMHSLCSQCRRCARGAP